MGKESSKESLVFFKLTKEGFSGFTFRVLFYEKRNAGTIDFTLLVASNSDFASANVILNQHP